jgi:IS30 family transposase
MEPYVHLSADERMLIYQWQREGLSQAEIARRLGRDRATVSRELRRNAIPAGYLPDVAQRRYPARRQRCRRRARLQNRRLQRNVLQLLERGLSPEQISGRLRVEQGRTVVNHETIYRFVYESPLGRQEKLYQYLRRGKKKRTRRQGRRSHVSPIAQRLFIDARPLAAAQRTEIGHWESDSLLFGHDQALNVLVERLSRFTVVTRLRNKTAHDTRHALVARLAQLPHSSITADNGSENADHVMVSHTLAIPFYFCHPYHSWEKGTVENTNGLIRRYLPRDTDLDRVDQGDLDAIASELNHRPRKCLGFRTPYEVLFGVSVALSY